MFETFSYLPPLSDEQIAAQVDYIVANGERGPVMIATAATP